MEHSEIKKLYWQFKKLTIIEVTLYISKAFFKMLLFFSTLGTSLDGISTVNIQGTVVSNLTRLLEFFNY